MHVRVYNTTAGGIGS